MTRDAPAGVAALRGTTGEYTTIRNKGREAIEHHINKSETLEHSQTSVLSKGFSLDLTAKQEVSYGGVTAGLEEHLGVTKNEEDSESSSESMMRRCHLKMRIIRCRI